MNRNRWIRLIALWMLPALACGGGGLWGQPADPTPEIPPVVQTLRAATASAPAPATSTPTPDPTPTPTALPVPTATETTLIGGGRTDAPILYYTQSGDTLPAVAARFGVEASEITSPLPLHPTALLDPGTLLVIPDRLPERMSPAVQIMPDSEVVYSPSAQDFDIAGYIRTQGGYLSTYRQWLGSTDWTTGTQAVERIALDNSLNPRLLLSLLEYQSHWVRGRPTNLAQSEYPLGNHDYYYLGLFRQLMWASEVLAEGYYSWRAGMLTELTFPDGSRLRLSPGLNAGSVAVMYFFAQLMNQPEWAQAMDPNIGYPALHAAMFGDPWTRAAQVEPLLPAGLTQPDLALPFPPNQTWYHTGGPHPVWEKRGALAALDFAPQADEPGCTQSPLWVTASAPGLVVRSAYGVVMLDLDGDGSEHTGWNLLYLHIAEKDRVAEGTWVKRDDPLGHPSCEGGVSTGTHLHFARKYNGEWILADGGLPFVLSGWTAHNGDRPYYGTLTRGDQVVTACPCGNAGTKILRTDP